MPQGESPAQIGEASSAIELVKPGINNNVCGRGEPQECGAGKVATCTTECVTPVETGQPCSPFPCQSNSVCKDQFAASCVRTSGGTWPSGTWVCATPDSPQGGVKGITFAEGCEMPPFSGTGALCPTDTYCKDVVECAHTEIGGESTICVTYQMQGSLCDADAGEVGCAVCAPGTTCVASADADLHSASHTGMDGFCRKPCQDADDCPCEKTGAQKHICESGFCTKCRGTFEACDDRYVCCDSDDICYGHNPGVSEGVCCPSLGTSCANESECCSAYACWDGVCELCHENNKPCAEDGDCCTDDGLACLGGICKPACIELHGTPCTYSAEKGECKKGTYSCDAMTGDLSCIKGSPVAETCNGKDDNCDGTIDNLTGSCSATVFGSSCQSGFNATGHWECNDDVAECVAEPGHDYCTQSGQVVNGQHCGFGIGDVCCNPANGPCNPATSVCTPNFICQGTTGAHTCVDDTGCPNPDPECWMPADAGDCY